MGCQKNKLTKVLDGKYTGQLTIIRSVSEIYEGSQFTSTDSTNDTTTYDINLEISNLKFKRFDANGTQVCDGDVEIDGDEITFNSSCDCLYTCCYVSNCTGDIIAGKYNFNFDNASLIMWMERENTSTLSIFNNDITTHIVSEKHYSLTKN